MDAVLQRAVDYLREEVRPMAQEIDQHVDALRAALQGLCDRDLLALKRPTEYGGPAMSEENFRVFQQEVARTSGALAFLQTQHQSAVSMLARSANSELKARYLPKMGNGEALVGIGFSQLRRPGPPIMRAAKTDSGYLLDGTVPWITGWSLFPEFLIGASLETGEALFAVVPLMDQPGINVSEPMRLAAMETAMTVSAEFDNWFVADKDVAFIKPGNWIQNNDLINIALQGHFALGCAQAGIDIVRGAAEKRGASFLTVAADALEAELVDCKEKTQLAQKAVSDDESPADSVVRKRLEVRAWAIDLAARCAHAAVTASSGAANSLSHPAQRVYREALVYTVSAQTTPIMEATLRRLVRSRK